MTKSLDKLQALTLDMTAKILEPIIETVDSNLSKATELIEIAQEALAVSAKDAVESHAHIINLTKEIERLVKETLHRVAEIKDLKKQVIDITAEMVQLKNEV